MMAPTVRAHRAIRGRACQRRAAPSAKIISAHFGCAETADGCARSVNSLFNFHCGTPKKSPVLALLTEPAFDVTPLWIKFLWAMRASHLGRLRSQGRRESHSQAALLTG